MAGVDDSERNLPTYEDAVHDDYYNQPPHSDRNTQRSRSGGRQKRSKRHRSRGDGDRQHHGSDQRQQYYSESHGEYDGYSSHQQYDNDDWADGGDLRDEKQILEEQYIANTPVDAYSPMSRYGNENNDLAVTYQPQPASRYYIPPAPSPMNGPYYQGKLRPEYANMKPPYPSLFHMQAQGVGDQCTEDEHDCAGQANDGGDNYTTITVRQQGRTATVQYHPELPAVTYIDSPDGDYGSDYMALSVFNLCCCFILMGAIGVLLSSSVRHARDTGDAKRSRYLSKVTMIWNVTTIIGGAIIIGVVLYIKLGSRAI